MSTPHTTTPTPTLEPLAADPQWEQINNAPFSSKLHVGSIHTPPAGYALGFRDGAYALAAALLAQMKENGATSVVPLLLAYERGDVRPTRGWKHESIH